MKFIYAVEQQAQLARYQLFFESYQHKLHSFLCFLEREYAVANLPSAVIFTSEEIATKDISSIPIPAYTNDYRTVFCPELNVWKNIYLRQLDDLDSAKIQEYYKTKLTENHVLQILGHEFVHHSNLFPDSNYESGIWFEEGMCEYISRKFFLSDEEFRVEANINRLLVELHREKYSQHSLEEFGTATYEGDYAGIFLEYWRSFLAVNTLVERNEGDVLSVFASYQDWLNSTEKTPLSHWFGLEE